VTRLANLDCVCSRMLLNFLVSCCDWMQWMSLIGFLLRVVIVVVAL